jgi:CheY-like chemotaxis protein
MVFSKRILLVEDNPNDVELTLEAFSQYNLVDCVQVARDGEEALDYLFRRGKFTHLPGGNPVVIFLDLKMPKVDGIEVLKKIKSEEGLKRVPVVVFSSSSEDRDLIECYELGVNAYVVKPVDFHEYIAAAKELGLFWTIINEPPPECKNGVKKLC